MKTTALRNWTVVCLCGLAAALVISASADQQITTTKNDKHYTGTVKSVDPKEGVLSVKGFLLGKTFNLGNSCACTFVGKGAGSTSDLRPGQKVTVSYQNADGVLVANRVEQQPLRYEGRVKAIDPEKRTMTMHRRALNKKFVIAEDCAVKLHGDKAGTIAAVKPGQRVSVIYEVPNGTPTARQIDQTSTTFTGTLTAIDLNARTLKAKHVFGTKKFSLADDCAITLNGKTDAKLSDLKLEDSLTLTYDTVDGVNVVNRIAQAEAPAVTPTAGVGQY